MADELEGQEQEANAAGGGADPAAVALALSGASRQNADEFLNMQSRYLDLQMKDLHEQRDLTLSHLQWRRISDWLRVSWQLLAAASLILIVAFVAAELISASRARDLVMDSISVPSDMALTGLTGEVAANEVLVFLNQMSGSVESYEQGRGNYRSATGQELKVAIPQTGISLGELDRLLRGWLGSETHIAGYITRDGRSVELTLRYGASFGEHIVQADGDTQALLRRAAEKIFAHDRPLRFATYLQNQGRFIEALETITPLSRAGLKTERSLALETWGGVLENEGLLSEAIQKRRAAVRLNPLSPTANAWLGFDESYAGRDQLAHDDLMLANRQWKGEAIAQLDPQTARTSLLLAQSYVARYEGDYRTAANDLELRQGISDSSAGSTATSVALEIQDLVDGHDTRRAQQLIDEQLDDPNEAAAAYWLRSSVASRLSNWTAAAEFGRKADLRTKPGYWMSPFLSTTAWPRWAISLVRTGDKDRAEKILSKIPTDCYLCVRARGTVALIEGQFGRADYWYRRAIADAPRLPAAYFELGALMIKRGRLDEAVSLFGSAQQYGPHFADPLEMWGEALMLKNRSDLALIKFADANKYAPNWGRLHMKWGEALGYLGRQDEARAQYRTASTLELSVAEKAELAKDKRG